MLRCVAAAAATLASRGAALVGMQQRQCTLHLGITLGELAAAEVEGAERLLEREQVLVAPVAQQARGDLILAGLDAAVAVGGQHLRVALTIDDGAHDFLAGHAGHVADGVGQLQVHQRHRLVHVLHVAALVAQQPGALAAQAAQGAHGVGRAEGAAQQAESQQLLQPLAVQHVGLAARHVLDLAGIDQQHLEAPALEYLEQRDPVHAGGLHRHDRHAALLKPVGHRVEVGGVAVEAAHGPARRFGWQTAPSWP